VELNAMNSHIAELYRAGKYDEAIPLANLYVGAAAARYGESAPQYAVALSWQAELLRNTNRFAEAEPLLKRVVEIFEKVEQDTGHERPNYAGALNNLAQLLFATNRLAEAEPLMRRALAIDEKSLGPGHPNVAKDLNNLAQLFKATNRLAEAEPLMRRALAIDEESFGPGHPEVATDLNNLAQLLFATNRLAEAEPLIRRALAIDEASFGPGHPKVAIDLNVLAVLREEGFGDYVESEKLKRRAHAIFEESFGPGHPNVATSLNNLAQLLQATNRLAEAEPLIRRALAIDEESLGPGHSKVAISLNNLAQLLQATNRLTEAEPLMLRALAIDEKAFGLHHTDVARDLNNLAQLLKATNRLAEAEPLIRRALAIDEESFGPGHPDVARDLNNLALLLQATNRLAEAEPLMRRALAIGEASFGPGHPKVAISLNNLAQLLQDTDRLAEAEPLARRALAIWEESLGPDHPNVASALNNLAGLLQGQGRWPESVTLFKKAKPIMTASQGRGEPERGALGKALLAKNSGNLSFYARALYRVNASDAANRSEGFELAQWELQNEAADALSSMAARFAKGGQALAKLVREQQDLLAAREEAYRSLDAAAGKADTKAAEATRAVITEIEAKLAAKQAALRQAFPDYADLANPKPLALPDAQSLLGDGDALVLFLDLWQISKVPEETIVFALTKYEARWTSIGLGTAVLRQRVAALRCGLDTGGWRDASRQKCHDLTGAEPAFDTNGEAIAETLPFRVDSAGALYRDLFGGIEEMIQGKRLFVVPSGALTQLPFEVLVTEIPNGKPQGIGAYKMAAWLGQRQAITILPSVAALKALRAAKASAAPEPYVGFGNPLLTGVDGTDKRAWDKQDCSKAGTPKQSRIATIATSIASLFRGGAINVEDLRRQPPLPETADELCNVGRELGVPEGGLGKAVNLGERASVSKVKALSGSGELGRARVVHFATHGLLAGETALFAKNKAEPALLLTPPAQASEEDNGLLTASEVAQLKLDADWVVMSACNTAGGLAEGAEALSGLARAFFYAGARSLLVSHWYVDSEAAVAITTGAVNAMKANPKVGRAEALRSAEAALIARGGRFAHPSIWAPFVLVGNGEK
jgi:CHAT domain-containing protein